MRYFIDTEFDENGRTIDLISIALVAEDGREFYGCNTGVDLEYVQPWLKVNVVPLLPPEGDPAWMTRGGLRERVEDMLDPTRHGKPEIWGYYGATDWVAFYQLWGRLLDMPKAYPKWIRELKQFAVEVGDPQLPPKPAGAHNALVDARWNRDVHKYLTEHRRV